MSREKKRPVQLEIDPGSVDVARRELRRMVSGNPIAEAAVEGFSDWEAVRALERMWDVALGRDPVEPDERERPKQAPRRSRSSRAG